MSADQEPRDQSHEEADVVAGAVDRSKEMLGDAGTATTLEGQPNLKTGYSAGTLAEANLLSQQDLADHGNNLLAAGSPPAEVDAAMSDLAAAGASRQPDLKVGYSADTLAAASKLGQQDNPVIESPTQTVSESWTTTPPNTNLPTASTLPSTTSTETTVPITTNMPETTTTTTTVSVPTQQPEQG